ncbi:CpaF family protein [Rubripirellula amarantea]|nr:CpaF family protein [Rubripirellula amarantea]
MKVYYNNIVDSDRRSVSVSGDHVSFGREKTNDVVLDSPYVAATAFELSHQSKGWTIRLTGIDILEVAGRRLDHGETLVVRGDIDITLFPFTITLNLPDTITESDAQKYWKLEEEFSEWTRAIHAQLLRRMDQLGDAGHQLVPDGPVVRIIEENIDEILDGMLRSDGHDHRVQFIAGTAVRTELLSGSVRARESSKSGELEQSSPTEPWQTFQTSVPSLEQELASVVLYLNQQLKDEHDNFDKKLEFIEQAFWPVWEKLVGRLDPTFLQYLARRTLKKQLKDTLYGYGPLEDLLRLPTVSEIMVVKSDRIYIEKSGVVQSSGRKFVSDAVTKSVIERIVGEVDRTIDRSRPLVDARLKDGSRVNAVISPLAVSGPCLTIRKFPLERLRVKDLIESGSFSHRVAKFLHASVLHHCNIVVSGGTGTGKTTLLNCLSEFIPDRERIVTIEDTVELQLSKQHVVQLETRSANVEGKGEYSIGDLVKNALRMRPDRIVVGECRGGEAIDMLQAMNTGHDGSLTTLHANSAQDALLRLEVLVQMASNMPVASIHRQIASAIHIIVQLNRFEKRRLVTQISEVKGISDDGGSVEIKDIFHRENPDAELLPTGHLPSFLLELVQAGKVTPEDFFLCEER